MYKIFYSLVMIIWIFDILDFQFVSFLDTEIPINTLAWFLIFCILPSSGSSKEDN